MINEDYYIEGLNKEENSIFARTVSLLDNFIFMIPNINPEYLGLIKKLQGKTPINYITRGRINIIKEIKYELQNEYIIVTFIKEDRN